MVLRIRVNAWQNASHRDRTIFRFVMEKAVVQEVPPVGELGGVQWFVAEDDRWRLIDLARLGVVVAGIAENTTYELPVDQGGRLDEFTLIRDLKAWVQPRIVWPVPGIGFASNPWQLVLDAQGAPAAIQASSGIPDGMVFREAA